MNGYRLAAALVGGSLMATAAIGTLTWWLCTTFGLVGGAASVAVVALGMFALVGWATHDASPTVGAQPVQTHRVDELAEIDLPAALKVDCPYCGQRAGDRCRFVTQRPPLPEPPAWWRTINPHPQREYAARETNGETR